MAQQKEAAARKLPGSLETNRRLDRWITINADGTVNGADFGLMLVAFGPCV